MCKGIPAAPGRFLQGVAGSLALLGAVFAGPAQAAAISERYIHDLYTGLALNGYDPVAYFVDGRARKGREIFEVVWDGAYWRFDNPGNAAAFMAAPKVFAPAYGGYNAVAVAEGRAQPGDPELFVLHKGRVYLFASAEDQARFRERPDDIVTLADARWPALLNLMSR